MKRRRLLITGVLLLLLGGGGAIVNVAVAWGLAYRNSASVPVLIAIHNDIYPTQRRWSGGPGLFAGGSDYVINEGNVPRRTTLAFGIGYLQKCASFDGKEFFDIPPAMAARLEFGWPLRGLSTSWKNSAANLLTGYSQYKPWRPIWPGFAINTIFYAAILWVMFFVPGMVRRRIRRRRGLCPACAYPFGSSPVCTECGNTISFIIGETR